MASQRHQIPEFVATDHPVTRIKSITVRLEWDEQVRSWVSFVPELNNISTFGTTPDEALDRTRDLILGYLNSMQELRLRVPLSPSQIREIRAALR